VPRSELAGQCARAFQLVGGDRGGQRRERDRTVAQGFDGERQEQRGIHASGISDEGAPERAQALEDLIALSLEISVHRRPT